MGVCIDAQGVGRRRRPATPGEEKTINDFNPVEQLVARVARGRQDRPDTTELALIGFGIYPFGDAERDIEGYLEDPHVDEDVKARIRALLGAVKGIGE